MENLLPSRNYVASKKWGGTLDGFFLVGNEHSFTSYLMTSIDRFF